jgi:tRNA pseudouridine38-40 synthase
MQKTNNQQKATTHTNKKQQQPTKTNNQPKPTKSNMSKRNVLLTIEYDGSGFHGWQIQPGIRTVQGVLTDALSRVTGEPIALNGSSRTDAGVHAYGAAASFKGDFGIPADRIPVAVNNLLTDIRIVKATEVPEDFHARFDAKGKTYLYRITAPSLVCSLSTPGDFCSLSGERPGNDSAEVEGSTTGLGCSRWTPCEQTAPNREQKSPGCYDAADIFMQNYRYQLNETPDKGNMKEAAKYFIGKHDFSAFRTTSDDAPPDAVRTISELTVDAEDGADTQGRPLTEYTLRVTGDGFLYNMVRIIAGTIVEVGLGRRNPAGIAAVIAQKDRRQAGHTAPASGLYLEKVYYGHPK